MKTYTITELTADEVNIIGLGLQEIPFKLSSPLLQKIQTQLKEQDKPAEESQSA